MSMEDVEQNLSEESPNKQRPRVIASEPDRSFDRYIIDEFKTKASGSKEVQFESIDINLYKAKAKLVGFKTSEDRIRFWIEACASRYYDFLAKQEGFLVTWEELESYCHPGKPDKVKVLVKKDDEKLFVISIFVSTGRIQVQGSYYDKWALTEFPLIMEMIEDLKSDSKDIPSSYISNSQKCIFTEEDKSQTNTVVEESSDDDEESSEDDEDESESEPDINVDLSVKRLANILATVETNFIQSRTSLESELYNIKQSLNEVMFIKDKIVQLENNNKAGFTGLGDRLYHNECDNTILNTKVSELSSQIKNLQEQNKSLLSKQTQMESNVNELRKENEKLEKELFLLREIIQKHENALENENDRIVQSSTPNFTEEENLQISQPTRPAQLTDDSVFLIIDSNGKFINPELLCPDLKVHIKKSYTLNQATENIQESTIQPKTILIHCGTNDLEDRNLDQVSNDSKTLIRTAQKKFTQAKIIFSSLLPRQDDLQHKVVKINQTMEEYCKTSGIQFADNSHISHPYQFYDSKHLNRRGFMFFAKNLKSSIYGTATRRLKPGHPSKNQDFSFPSNQRPHLGQQYRGPPPQFQVPRNNNSQGDLQHQHQATYASVTASRPSNYSSTQSANFTLRQPMNPGLLNSPVSQNIHLQGEQQHQSHPTYASVTPAPGPVNYSSKHLSNSNAQQSLNSGILNSTGLPVSLKSLIQQLQLFV